MTLDIVLSENYSGVCRWIGTCHVDEPVAFEIVLSLTYLCLVNVSQKETLANSADPDQTQQIAACTDRTRTHNMYIYFNLKKKKIDKTKHPLLTNELIHLIIVHWTVVCWNCQNWNLNKRHQVNNYLFIYLFNYLFSIVILTTFQLSYRN